MINSRGFYGFCNDLHLAKKISRHFLNQLEVQRTLRTRVFPRLAQATRTSFLMLLIHWISRMCGNTCVYKRRGY